MSNLSPAAQAVLDAVNCEIYKPASSDKADTWRLKTAAAALRAAVEKCKYVDDYGDLLMNAADVEAIAAELEAPQ